MRFMVIVLPVLLIGCSFNKQVHDDFKIDPNSNEGLVVLSTRLYDGCVGGKNSADLDVIRLTNNNVELAAEFKLQHEFTEFDFKNPPGYFYIRRYKAGDYRITNYTLGGHGGSYRSKKNLDINFHVAPGKIHYLGEIFVDVPDCSKFKVKVTDQRDRDAAIFDKKMKNLNSKMFDYQILKITN